ncbi:MAG: hypothetical protein E7511_04565 [Ruminococcus sp.]|nr:hypothetical protein [Ruminococcus sp.]
MKPDDWRLLNDTEFLRNQPLAAMTANEMLEHFSHLKHCHFCWESLPKQKLHYHPIWLVTADGETCVCDKCFADLKEMLHLTEDEDLFDF